MSVLVLTSVTVCAVCAVAVSRSPKPPRAPLADPLRGPLGVSEAEIVRDLAASFETREG